MLTAQRKPLFDSLRGFAMLLMAIFHFAFDLDDFKVLEIDFLNSNFWIAFQNLIVTLFVLLVGISLSFSRPQYRDQKYQKRLLQIGFGAALISLVTYALFGSSWVFFGVLHFIFLVMLLAPTFTPALLKRPIVALALGIAFVAIPIFYRAPWFHQPGWNLLGLSPWPQMSEDFTPILPWLGVIFLGLFIGSTVEKWPARVTALEIPGLSRLGRHALIFYLLHQAVLFPLAWAISR